MMYVNYTHNKPAGKLRIVRRETRARAGSTRRHTSPNRRTREEKREGDAHQRVALLPSELLAEELDDGLEAVRGGDLVEVLLHDGRVPDSLEPHDDCRGADAGAWWAGIGIGIGIAVRETNARCAQLQQRRKGQRGKDRTLR